VQDIAFETGRKIEAIDLTDRLAALDLSDGFAWISIPHTTGGLILCESDPEMLSDIERVAAELLAPFEPFRHNKNDNPNAAAHLLSSLFGSQLILPVVDGRLSLGTYQRILFVELDGPRQRQARVGSLVAAG
jgi:secondary thiamine-phosphate synthase enzyme